MKGTTIVMCVLLVALCKNEFLRNFQNHFYFIIFIIVGCAYGACDPWGARKCGEDFFDCYNNTIKANWPSDLICQCYKKQGACLTKYKCASGPTLSIFKTNCLAQKCAEYQCSGASGMTLSVVAVLFTLLFTLF